MKKLTVLTFVLILGLSVIVFAQDSFEQQTAVTRNPRIDSIQILLSRSVNPDQAAQSIIYSIAIYDQFNEPMKHKRGNLVPHLTTAQKNQLSAFMDMIWTKVESEITP